MRYVWEPQGQVRGDDRVIAQIRKARVRERAEVIVGGEEWLFHGAAGWGRGPLVAEQDGRERMRATVRGFWTHNWTIESSHATLQIRPTGFLHLNLELTRSGRPVGRFHRRGFLQNRTDLTSSEELVPEVAAFVLWVASVEHDRRHRRVSARSS